MAQPTSRTTIPPDVAVRIARFAPDRPTLAALARTSRALQNAAEARLYAALDLVHHPTSLPILAALAATPRNAARVRSFSLLPPRGFVYAHGRGLELGRGGMHEFYAGYGYGLGGVYEADVRALRWQAIAIGARCALRCQDAVACRYSSSKTRRACVRTSSCHSEPPRRAARQLLVNVNLGDFASWQVRRACSSRGARPPLPFSLPKIALEVLTLGAISPPPRPDPRISVESAVHDRNIDVDALLAAGALPRLRVYEGPLRLALCRLRHAPLTHLREM